jgi:hypothetical protein
MNRFPGRRRILALGAVLAVVSAAGVWAVNPGQLDPSFGQGGWATVVFDFAPWDGLQPARMVAGPDGRIFACGEVFSDGGADSDFALAALTSSGELDPGFDGDGRQVLPFDLLGTGQGDDGATASLWRPTAPSSS